MSFEEIDAEESISSLSEVSSLDDDLDSTCLESGSSVEEMTDDKMDSNSWNETNQNQMQNLWRSMDSTKT